MKILPHSIELLVESFERLPGIGPKTANRLSFYLLHVPQEQLDQFANSLSSLKKNTVFCSVCFNIGEADPCVICQNSTRDHSIICVVEQPMDIVSLEKTGKIKYVYHVLHGAINPLENIGPEEIRIFELIKRIKNSEVKEVILAMNANMEGEATAMYIKREIKMQNPRVKITRLAHGLPVGGDLEYADEHTLSQALENRKEY
jgi:recombination protein RecR